MGFAPHDISIFQYLNNKYPINIDAKGSSFLQKGIYDSTITQLSYSNNVEGHIFVSWLHPFKEHRLVVIGSKGMLTFEDSSSEKKLKLYDKGFEVKNGIPTKVDGSIKTVDYGYEAPLEAELKYFIAHCNSKKPIIANSDHAIDVTRILVEASKQINKNKYG